jgi:hypothetical protein
MLEIREITRISQEYFQKSQFFLYPLLKIPHTLSPERTYMQWKNFTVDDYMLTCIYSKINDPNIQQLEKQHMLSNPMLLDVYPADDQIIYVFDFKQYRNNWDVVVKGEYSRMSKYAKDSILAYYKQRPEKEKYAHCYLYPDLYYEVYADLLQVDVSLFYEGTELISEPDLDKETCRLK